MKIAVLFGSKATFPYCELIYRLISNTSKLGYKLYTGYYGAFERSAVKASVKTDGKKVVFIENESLVKSMSTRWDFDDFKTVPDSKYYNKAQTCLMRIDKDYSLKTNVLKASMIGHIFKVLGEDLNSHVNLVVAYPTTPIEESSMKVIKFLCEKNNIGLVDLTDKKSVRKYAKLLHLTIYQ